MTAVELGDEDLDSVRFALVDRVIRLEHRASTVGDNSVALEEVARIEALLTRLDPRGFFARFLTDQRALAAADALVASKGSTR